MSYGKDCFSVFYTRFRYKVTATVRLRSNLVCAYIAAIKIFCFDLNFDMLLIAVRVCIIALHIPVNDIITCGSSCRNRACIAAVFTGTVQKCTIGRTARSNKLLR